MCVQRQERDEHPSGSNDGEVNQQRQPDKPPFFRKSFQVHEPQVIRTESALFGAMGCRPGSASRALPARTPRPAPARRQVGGDRPRARHTCSEPTSARVCQHRSRRARHGRRPLLLLIPGIHEAPPRGAARARLDLDRRGHLRAVRHQPGVTASAREAPQPRGKSTFDAAEFHVMMGVPSSSFGGTDVC